MRAGVLAAFLSLPLTGIALHIGGWFNDPSLKPSPSLPVRCVPTPSSESLSSAAAQRWRQSQPRHWRSCLLQH